MKRILKLSLIVGVLFVLLSVSAFAASISSVSGTDGTNTFAESAAAVTAETPIESTITLSGTADTANANISIKVETEGVIVYVNQIVSKADKSFTFSFPVSLEHGRLYEIGMNIEGSTSAPKKLYFKAPILKYGDLSRDNKVNNTDLTQLLRYASAKGYSNDTATSIAEGRGDIQEADRRRQQHRRAGQRQCHPRRGRVPAEHNQQL